MEQKVVERTDPTLAVYVAAASAEISRAENFIARLSNSGYASCTHDWTKPMRAHGADALVDTPTLRVELQADLHGVDACDVLAVLVPPFDIATQGAWWECSRAKAWNDLLVPLSDGSDHCDRKLILAVMPSPSDSVPAWLRCFADHVVVGESEADAWLRGYALGIGRRMR